MIDLGTIRNILVVTLDHLGDVLLTFPAIERLRRMFPDARITALVGSWAETLTRGNGCIDDVLTYDFFEASSSQPHKLLDDEEIDRVASWLSAPIFDLAVDFRREPQTREFLRWSRARYTVGFANWKESEWLTIGLPYEANLHRVKPRRHVCQELIHLVEMIEVAGREDVCPHVTVPASEVDTVKALLGSLVPRDERLLVAIHPGSGREIKCWPAEHFARLADLLMDRLNARVVLFGTASEVSIVQLIQSCMRRSSETASLAGKLTIAQFLAALKHFDCFIGNDSGPTHMAAAGGLPTLCICSGTIDPAQWAPIGPAALVIQRQMICSPCYLRDREECPFDVACLSELSVEAVWDATLRMLLPCWQKLVNSPEFFVSSRSRRDAMDQARPIMTAEAALIRHQS